MVAYLVFFHCFLLAPISLLCWRWRLHPSRTDTLLARQVLSPWPERLDASNVSINSIQYCCFASAFAPSKPSILCFAFLMFPTISGNLLLARSKPRRLNYMGFWYGKSTFVSTDFHRFSAPVTAAGGYPPALNSPILFAKIEPTNVTGQAALLHLARRS